MRNDQLGIRVMPVGSIEQGERVRSRLELQESLELSHTRSRMRRLSNPKISPGRCEGCRRSRRAGVATSRPGAPSHPLSRGGGHDVRGVIGRVLWRRSVALLQVTPARFGHQAEASLRHDAFKHAHSDGYCRD